MIIFLLALKLAGTDAHERDTVAVRLVHIGLYLENKGREARVERVDYIVVRDARQRRHGQLQKLLKEGFNAEVIERRAEEHRTESAASDLFDVKVIARAVKQLNIVGKRFAQTLAYQLVQLLGLVQFALDSADAALPAVEFAEREYFLLLAVIHALELLPAADGPVHRISPDAELVLQLLHEVVRTARLAVELVDKGEYGDVPHGAYLEELAGLRLDALCGVDDHDGGVRRHKRPIRVLGEVLVAGGVEDVDTEALVLKLHNGRGY